MKAKENKKRRFCFSISDTEEFYSMFNRGASRFNFFFFKDHSSSCDEDKQGYPNFSTIDISSQMIICCGAVLCIYSI